MIYVYWNAGRCQEGDHSFGLAGFRTIEEAEAHLRNLRASCSPNDVDFSIIEGIILKDAEASSW